MEQALFTGFHFIYTNVFTVLFSDLTFDYLH